jgi:electron transfer flavoprotein alpha subunit
MRRIWAVVRAVDGRPTRLGLGLATLARTLSETGRFEPVGLLVGPDAEAAGAVLAEYLPRVLASPPAPSRAWAAGAAKLVIDQVDLAHDILLVGAEPDGLALAGMLVGARDLPILVNATSVRWEADGLSVGMSTFGGRIQTTSGFAGEGGGIVVVRSVAVSAAPAGAVGSVERVDPSPDSAGDVASDVAIVELVSPGGAPVPAIEEARVVVGGGRGVGGADGFRLLGELASVLEGVVGGTRAAVDAGWIDYAQQIGQTGKTVRPDLYLACGISGALQHRVGVHTAGTIVAIDRDPDAPIREFADMLVVGDLFQIVPALIEAIGERRASS